MAFGRKRGGGERRGTPSDLLVVGLGNPGPRYENSLHNVGADAVERLAAAHGEQLKPSKDAEALVAEFRMDTRRVVGAFPTTFMNESGRAVSPLCRRFGIEEPTQLLVVHDELDLPLGQLKVKKGGGLAGHNGLKSIRDHLHTTDFLRVRIGVGKPPGGPERGADHVLSKMSKAAAAALAEPLEQVPDIVAVILDQGVDAAMSSFNSRSSA